MKCHGLLVAVFGLLFSQVTFAGGVTGKIGMLEVWQNGNIAFTVVDDAGTNLVASKCNGQFVLNRSAAGTKNQYAILVTAHTLGKKVAISYDDTCGTAENYNSSPYIIPIYVYPS